MTPKATQRELSLINELIAHFIQHRPLVNTFLGQVLVPLNESPELGRIIHSIRSRTKDPEHLRDKLLRKLQKCKSERTPFELTKKNLFTRVTDLVGVRILHLHTRQVQDIDRILKDIFREHKFEVIEGPFARTWDDESREYFQGIGVKAQKSDTMYTSVHYVLSSNSVTTQTCEVQVRTLMEEVWGEVDHEVNYPHPNEQVACREQIRALARVTSSATRLVDSIFATVQDFEAREKCPARKRGS
jgi:putative GTP pyrophosphokinase